MIKAEIITDSTNWLGKRLTTFVLEYPRYIHAEFMTHRIFSKNGASSRAIPIQKVIQDVKKANVLPMWTAKQKGMQGALITDEKQINDANSVWLETCEYMCNIASTLDHWGIHKQNANRLLEPFFLMRMVVTATEFDNFFALRDHPDATPELQVLARAMKEALAASEPKFLKEGEWHIPFGDKMPDDEIIQRSYNLLFANTGWEVEPDRKAIFDHSVKTMLQIATARCARISYLTFAGEININDDLRLYADLVNGDPQHLSPTEHIAQVPTRKELVSGDYDTVWVNMDGPNGDSGGWSQERGRFVSNLNGWKQYRKVIENQKYK